MKNYVVASAFLFLISLTSFQVKEKPIGVKEKPCDVIVISREDISGDKLFQADKIILKSGGSIRVRNGSTLTLLALEELVIEGTFTIDGRGVQGANGGGGGAEWNSGCVGGMAGFSSEESNPRHKDWSNAGSSADKGGDGGQGGNGATVKILYGAISGVYGGKNNLNIYVDGGKGGSGGTGRRLVCGCCGKSKYGPSGSNGSDGYPGRYTFKEL